MEASIQSAKSGFRDQTLLRQLGLMVGLAVSIALGVAVVLWAQEPEYRLLFNNLDERDVSIVLSTLDQMDIKYNISDNAHSIMVPSDEMKNIRLQLAQKGIPRSEHNGFELLQEKQSFGTSQFLEQARYRQALAGELSRTISSMTAIRAARVHLAIPKQAVFLRDKHKSSASVFVDLYSNKILKRSYVDSIVNLVSSSVPGMKPEDVTVVDHQGNLLTNNDDSDVFSRTSKQLSIQNQIENDYSSRILSILEPILGGYHLRAQVSADVDFTSIEQTSEVYDPNKASIRSLQHLEEKNDSVGSIVGGVPGALSNVVGKGESDETTTSADSNNQIKIHETKNFELNKTISHTQQQPWKLLKLSVAVAIDDRKTINEDGEVIKQPLSTDELERITLLVKNTVGFNETRGDSINIVNLGFLTTPEINEAPEPPFWTQAWFFQLIKYIIAGLFVIILVFSILRPLLKRLSLSIGGTEPTTLENSSENNLIDNENLQDENLSSMMSLPAPSETYSAQLESIKHMVKQNPERVAQVVMNWVGDDDE